MEVEMQKSEAEKAVRHLCHTWASENGLKIGVDHASFSAFKAWLQAKECGHILDFKSRMGAEYDAEMWFDQEMKQNWRR